MLPTTARHLNECLKKRLLPFIKKYHEGKDPILDGYSESPLRKESSRVVIAYRNRLSNLGRKPTKGIPGSTHRKILGYLQGKVQNEENWSKKPTLLQEFRKIFRPKYQKIGNGADEECSQKD
jgi:hypothetical protein